MANSISDSSFLTSGQVGNYQSYQASQNREPVQNLGKDEFLQLLAVQMSNQDPLEPMEDTDFIAQMAQFTSLEQMQQLNQSFGVQQAYTLIGKNVVGTLDDTTQIIGTVTGVTNSGSKTYLQVGSHQLPLEKVQEIYDTGHEANSLVAQSGQLVGKYIEAEIPVDRTDILTGATVSEFETVKGEVESVLVKNFTVYVKLKGSDKDVPVAYITQISDKQATATDSTESADSADGADKETASGGEDDK